MLEAVMGWYGGHLHAFDVDGREFSPPDADGNRSGSKTTR
jgi:hypothetical protein